MTLTMARPETASGAPAPRNARFGVAMLALATVVGILAGLALGVLALRPRTPVTPHRRPGSPATCPSTTGRRWRWG